MHVCVGMCITNFYSLANDRVHPGGVALRNLKAGQSAGFDDEVIHAKLDILGFHFLRREGNTGSDMMSVQKFHSVTHLYLVNKKCTHSIEFLPKLEHLVHVDIYRQIIVGDGLFGLHQPLSDHLQERRTHALQL